MQSNKKPWPLKTLHGIRERINTNPDFQRPLVWGTSQKQLLIDTILRDYDIPKLYWRKVASKPDKYDVVDGQQRLRAIWDFFDGKFKLPKDSDDIDGMKIANLQYSELPDELRMKLDVYPLDVVIMQETDEEEVREMFLRLQNGTTLKAQEKRNAYPGKMRDFVKQVAAHLFFSKVGFADSRYTYDHVAAQMICLEMGGEPVNVKNADLNRMYDNNQDFDSKSAIAKAILRNLSILNDVFTDKTPELERYNVISLYCVIAELLRNYVINDIQPHLFNWFVEFELKRREEESKPEDSADPEWISYKDKISHSTDSADSIKARMEFMLRNLFEIHPQIRRKDNQRDFTYIQKLTVFRRDKGACQLRIKCNGQKVTWDDWHCDHKIPWSKGGPSTVENGQVSCSNCNLSKGSSSE
jgi:hypothetical protein